MAPYSERPYSRASRVGSAWSSMRERKSVTDIDRLTVGVDRRSHCGRSINERLIDYAHRVVISHQNVPACRRVSVKRHLPATPARSGRRQPGGFVAMIEIFFKETAMSTSQDISMYTA